MCSLYTFAHASEHRSLRLRCRWLAVITSPTRCMSRCWEQRRHGTPHHFCLQLWVVGMAKWCSHRCTSRWIPCSMRTKKASLQPWRKATQLVWRSYKISCPLILVWSVLAVRICPAIHPATSLVDTRLELWWCKCFCHTSHISFSLSTYSTSLFIFSFFF